MGILKIIEGSFPKQTAAVLPKNKKDKLVIRNHEGGRVIYDVRQSLRSFDVIIDHKRNPTIKVILVDGHIIVAKTDRKTFEMLQIALALGPELEAHDLVIDPVKYYSVKKSDPTPLREFMEFCSLWIIGVFFGFIGLIFIVNKSYLSGLFFALAMLLIIPPVRRKLGTLQKLPNTKMSAIIIIALFILGIFSLNDTDGQELEALRKNYAENHETLLMGMKADYAAGNFAKAVAIGKPFERVAQNEFSRIYWDSVAAADREAAKNRQKRLTEDFNDNRAAILKNMKALIAEKKYREAKNLFDQYANISDAEFTKLGSKAASAVAKEDKIAEKVAAKNSATAVQQESEAAIRKISENGTLRAIGQTLCERAVKRTLKAPSTADFPWAGGNVAIAGPREAIFTSYVDAQNGFGAMIRTNYVCSLEFTGSVDQAGDVTFWQVTGVAGF